MAFPVIQTKALTAEGTNVTLHTLTFPSGLVSGNTILSLFVCDGNQNPTWPGGEGWTRIVNFRAALNSATLAVAYKKSDGTETGNYTVTTSGSEESAHVTYRIDTAADSDVDAPFAGGPAAVASTSPNPGDCNPDAGATDFLWLALFGADDDDLHTGVPADYTDQDSQKSGTGTGTCNLGVARRNRNAARENPGVFTTPTAEEWAAITIAVFPASTTPVTFSARVSAYGLFRMQTDAALFSASVVTSDRRARVSAFEFEVPFAPRRARVSAFEFEVPTAPRRARVSAFEFEVPFAPRRARVSAFEFEVPIVSRRARVSAFEFEVPFAPRRARVSAFEFEIPLVGAGGVARPVFFDLTDPVTRPVTTRFFS